MASPAALITSVIVSPRLRALRRGLAASRRRISGGKPMLQYFHQADDPYSALTAQILPRLAATYDIAITPHLVPPPDAAAAPDGTRLAGFSLRDAARLAQAHGLSFPPAAEAPDPARLHAAQAALTAALTAADFAAQAAAISAALWSANPIPGHAAPPPTIDAALAAGAAQRTARGHYLGATFYFESEWFWGIDRLPYLESRLAPFRAAGQSPLITQLSEPRLPPLGLNAAPETAPDIAIEFFPSLRSPYTYLAAARVRALAARHGARLILRPVLPMVMRGLPVPLAKRMYIVRDTKREAERLGMPFGKIADPVGRPTERGLAVLFKVMQTADGSPFLESFLRGVFAEGIDAGTDSGLSQIAARAGVSDATIAASLADESWRDMAEANRNTMLQAGLWGVPSFRVTGCDAWWGQDRLWAVEQDLATIAARHTASPQA